jgi:60 kDa SS-A/Ro ribonucleoprotein
MHRNEDHMTPRTDPLLQVSTRRTPQSQPADNRQVPNSAGGYTFEVGRDARVHRFLTLGTTGGTYYVTEKALTVDTAGVVLDAARENAAGLVEQVVAVSTAGRAPRHQPAIFALAAASALGDETGRKAAYAALPAVCRTGTHLFTWAGYREQFAGWGRGAMRAVAGWYTDRPVSDVAYQVAKYRQRESWTHRDLLRLTHPRTVEDDRNALFRWVLRGSTEGVPPLISAFVEAQATTDVPTWVRLIAEHPLSWEMLPDAALTEPAVWEALIARGMPQTALIRQLPRLTRLGVVAPMSAMTRTVASQLTDHDRLRKGRVHPVNLLVALRTYASGSGARSDATWTPVREIVDALDSAFYAAFGTVEPAGKRTMLALDVSGSMTSPAGGTPLSCREASAALALVSMATEPQTVCVGFTSASGMWSRDAALRDLPISSRQRLNDAIRAVSNLPFGGTDCSLPMRWALERKVEVDTFIVYTDNETWAGPVHPHQALAAYRRSTGIDARMAVVALTPTNFTIADPDDPGQLDVSGFDAAVPNMLADFSRGDI